ncbi:helix-turn-helix transcriptional regulator [Streptosporangiaceae bacterium NEAU-GS5]|nr:helix-turn-helix transcriptional regulator [Streptosporangiaceae bacterium NEAU-GS5]
MTDTRFGNRMSARRKGRGLTEQALADASGAHVTQIRRYEAGTSRPILDVLRNLILALNTSADSLLFDPDEHAAVPAMIEGSLLRHHARHPNVS